MYVGGGGKNGYENPWHIQSGARRHVVKGAIFDVSQIVIGEVNDACQRIVFKVCLQQFLDVVSAHISSESTKTVSYNELSEITEMAQN